MEEKAKNTAEVICRLIEDAKSQRECGSLQFLLAVLMDAQVSVPMTVTMDEADTEKFLHANVGDTISTSNTIRMKPDFLKDGAGNLYLGVFTTIEESGKDYSRSFSWVTMDFMNCVHSAYHNDTCSGIVINAFSNPFVLEKPLLNMMLKAEKAESD